MPTAQMPPSTKGGAMMAHYSDEQAERGLSWASLACILQDPGVTGDKEGQVKDAQPLRKTQ